MTSFLPLTLSILALTTKVLTASGVWPKISKVNSFWWNFLYNYLWRPQPFERRVVFLKSIGSWTTGQQKNASPSYTYKIVVQIQTTYLSLCSIRAWKPVSPMDRGGVVSFPSSNPYLVLSWEKLFFKLTNVYFECSQLH